MGNFIQTQKEQFITQTQSLAAQFESLKATANDVYAFYWANAFNTGGANELVAGDLTGTQWEGMTVADINTVGATISDAFNTWINAEGRLAACKKVQNMP